MSCLDPDDMADSTKVREFVDQMFTSFIVHVYNKLYRHCYGLTCGAVFPNLSRSGLGRHMDKEAFRKMFKRMMKSK